MHEAEDEVLSRPLLDPDIPDGGTVESVHLSEGDEIIEEPIEDEDEEEETNEDDMDDDELDDLDNDTEN